MATDEREDIKDKLSRILFILESDPKTNTKGLVERVHAIEVALDALLTREQIYKAKATTWGIIGGAIGGAVTYIFKFAITKFI